MCPSRGAWTSPSFLSVVFRFGTFKEAGILLELRDHPLYESNAVARRCELLRVAESEVCFDIVNAPHAQNVMRRHSLIWPDAVINLANDLFLPVWMCLVERDRVIRWCRRVTDQSDRNVTGSGRFDLRR